jgi:uncharacterized protein YndB with AHSA1/START domain
MAAISESVEISRRPEDVFAYLDDPSRHGEWQERIVAARVETEGATGIGTRVVQTRRAGGREQTFTYEITEHDPPRSFAFRTLDGPLRPMGKGRVEPVSDGTRSRFTLDFDFESHGLAGKLLRPIALRQARKQIPKDQQRMKERLESGAV